MNAPVLLPNGEPIVYPDSDGQPMADNTLQFQWIVTLQGNHDALFAHDPQVFVAGDLLWYPVQGQPTIRAAPDVLIAFGRPKGYRGSYKQWEEGGVAPQVVWEVLSPGNRPPELQAKLEFYDRHGVELYYQYDPDTPALRLWQRQGGRLVEQAMLPGGWICPRTGVRLVLGLEGLEVHRPDGRRFLTFLELEAQREAAQRQAAIERQQREAAQCQAAIERQQREAAQRQAEIERAGREAVQQQVEAERQQREAAEARAAALAQRLRALGLDPDIPVGDQST